MKKALAFLLLFGLGCGGDRDDDVDVDARVGDVVELAGDADTGYLWLGARCVVVVDGVVVADCDVVFAATPDTAAPFAPALPSS